MPELIDRYALKNHLYLSQAEAFKRSEWYVAGAIQSFINLLDKQPTVVSEVRHGRWIYDETIGGMKHYYCSSCKECDPDNKCFADENQILWFSFCPKCGADMREEGAETVELKPCPFCGGKA